jgi:hypothetical protein
MSEIAPEPFSFSGSADVGTVELVICQEVVNETVNPAPGETVVVRIGTALRGAGLAGSGATSIDGAAANGCEGIFGVGV